MLFFNFFTIMLLEPSMIREWTGLFNKKLIVLKKKNINFVFIFSSISRLIFRLVFLHEVFKRVNIIVWFVIVIRPFIRVFISFIYWWTFRIFKSAIWMVTGSSIWLILSSTFWTVIWTTFRAIMWLFIWTVISLWWYIILNSP